MARRGARRVVTRLQNVTCLQLAPQAFKYRCNDKITLGMMENSTDQWGKSLMFSLRTLCMRPLAAIQRWTG